MAGCTGVKPITARLRKRREERPRNGDHEVGENAIYLPQLANRSSFYQNSPMPHYLLLGAGFSRNWGGWLAAEVFEYLLGRPEIADNETLRRVLWEAQLKGGFEYALETLQAAAAQGRPEAAQNLAPLEAAVIAMFNDMNENFDSILDWEFSNHFDRQISTFLTKFEAIFTLT